jgi:hypothetical protein
MLKVFTDFNARTHDGVCWNLVYNEIDLADKVDKLNLKGGDKIILYQDDDDFEVIATLDFRWVDVLGRDTWVAVPDWDTMVRKG